MKYEKNNLNKIAFLFLTLIALYMLPFVWRNIRKDAVIDTREFFIVNMIKQNYAGIYGLAATRIKKLYSMNECTLLFQSLYQKNKCLRFATTRVNSAENFNILITDCSYNKVLCVVSFGENRLANWQITNIVLK